METKRTDKDILVKGLKIMLGCLVCMFAGPFLLHTAFANDDKPLYIPLLILGGLISIMAIFLLFKGVNTIMKSLFNS